MRIIILNNTEVSILHLLAMSRLFQNSVIDRLEENYMLCQTHLVWDKDGKKYKMD